MVLDKLSLGILERVKELSGEIKITSIHSCDKYQRPLTNCICDHRQDLDSNIHFWILSYPNEFAKPTNSARRIDRCLPSVRFFQWKRTEPAKDLLGLLTGSSFNAGLVFPDQMAFRCEVGNWTDDANASQVAFLLIDCIWQQVRKIYRQSSNLYRLPLISFDPDYLSRYNLRRFQKGNQHCTAETVVELLRLQGEEGNAQSLQNCFYALRIFVVGICLNFL